MARNSTAGDDGDRGLRGGTERGGAAPLIDPNAMPSEATVGHTPATPAGGGAGGPGKLPVDPAALNAGDPAARRKAGLSDGNMPHKSQHDPDDPANPLHPADA